MLVQSVVVAMFLELIDELLFECPTVKKISAAKCKTFYVS